MFLHPRRIIRKTKEFLFCLFNYYITPDKWYLKRQYKKVFGKNLDLCNPLTYNEKIQWLKLYDRNPKYHILVDKYRAKEWAASIIGCTHIIPTIAVFNKVEDIDWDALPNQFVIKCNHDSASVSICRDKNAFNFELAKKKLKIGLSQDYYHTENKQWAYKGIKRLIIVEKYLEDNNNDDALMDYKWFCFNGEPKYMYISRDRGKRPTTDFFDIHFNHLPIRMQDPNSDIIPDKPAKFEEMYNLASKLSVGIPHVRVDFYVVDNIVYFGEMTFYHCGGMAMLQPYEWNVRFGNDINLSLVRSKYRNHELNHHAKMTKYDNKMGGGGKPLVYTYL